MHYLYVPSRQARSVVAAINALVGEGKGVLEALRMWAYVPKQVGDRRYFETHMMPIAEVLLKDIADIPNVYPVYPITFKRGDYWDVFNLVKAFMVLSGPQDLYGLVVRGTYKVVSSKPGPWEEVWQVMLDADKAWHRREIDLQGIWDHLAYGEGASFE